MLRAIIYPIAVAVAVASQITSATAASADWDRTVLPRPSQPFQGVANRTLEGSKASFTEPVKAPPGAPNILLVLIDDAGFGNPSTFGGPVATPTLDKLAAEGLRYNRFYVTALCSPTRARVVVGSESSCRRIRVDLRVNRWLAGLQHPLADQCGFHRADSSGERLQHCRDR